MEDALWCNDSPPVSTLLDEAEWNAAVPLRAVSNKGVQVVLKVPIDVITKQLVEETGNRKGTCNCRDDFTFQPISSRVPDASAP